MDAARFALDQPDGSSRGGGKARGVSFNSENTFVGGGGRKSSTALQITTIPVSYTHLRAHETLRYLVCTLSRMPSSA